MNKRAKFVLVSVLLAIGLWLSQIAPVDNRLSLILILTVVTYVLAAWVLFEDIKGVEWVTLLILPVMFTLGAGFFANYLPVMVPNMAGMKFGIQTSMFLAGLVRAVFFVLFAIGMYAILLTENIFSVASIRTIQLLRAARSVGFIMSLIIGLFFFHALLGLRLPFYVVGAGAAIVSFILSVSGFWAVDLKAENMKEVYWYALVVAWLMAQLAAGLTFWPVKALMGGLIMVAGLYTLLGIFEQRMVNRVFLGNFLEYVVFSLIVVIVGFLTTSWRG